MANIISQRSIHSDRLERWLGVETVDQISKSMGGDKDRPRWYGRPIGVSNVPGKLYATADGDFVGKIAGGQFAGSVDYFVDRLKYRYKKWEARQKRVQLNAGFSSLSDLIAEATAGKRREFRFLKSGTTGVANTVSSLWGVGSQPAAGAVASAAPGGRVPNDTTTGTFPFTNPDSGDTQHFVSGYPLASVAGNTLLLYDRLFDVVKTASSSATEAVSGTPSRYQSITDTDPDSAIGNFLFIEQFSALASVAHNWTVCTYTDQNGNTGATLPSVTGSATGLINRLDMPTYSWFCPLAAGDTGIKNLTQMQCSSASITGNANFVIGHPLVWMPCPIASLVCVVDGINSAFNLTRIFDDACLAFLEVSKPSTSATTYTGSFTTVAG